MNTYHAAVWLDHQEAHVFHIARASFEETLVLPEHPHRRLHRKSGPGADSGKRAQEDHGYYEDVVKALSDSQEIVIVGPATASSTVKHIQKHHHDMEQKIIGVETTDHPTARQVIAYARRYFKAREGS